MLYGGQTEVGQIESILIKRPQDGFISQDHLNAQWQKLNYQACPDFRRAIEEYDQFVHLLKQTAPRMHFLPRAESLSIDSVYVRDAMIMTDRGAILCNMGKKERRGEPEIAATFLKELEVPVLGSITGDGRLEGGDLIWLDNTTLVVGRGYRTNDEGIRQLRELTHDLVDWLVVVPLPHWSGPNDVMHLMSLISPVDHDLAAVYSRLLPVPFRELLLERGIRLVEVPDSEFETMGCNILAVAPGKCITLEGNPQTMRLLEKAGVEVMTYVGNEISRKGAGGPSCLTRPLRRKV